MNEMPVGFTFLPQSRVWVFRIIGIQYHLRPDGAAIRIIEE